MGKLNSALRGKTIRAGVTGTVNALPTAVTNHQGGPGHALDLKSELFTLAVANFVGENTFYEDGAGRDARYAKLVHDAAIADPEWTADLLTWLRTEGNLRSAAIVGAVEYAAAVPGLNKVRATGSHLSARSVINAVCQRADEPGEILAYHLSRFGRRLPKGVSRGLGDAILRLYTEFTVGKWDSARNAVRFADVIELSSVDNRTRGQAKEPLFRYLLDERPGKHRAPIKGRLDESLPMLAAAATLRADAARNPRVLMDTDRLRAAGLTWQDALSLAGDKVDKAKLWQAIIPTMGFLALLRNLNNFDRAGIDGTTRKAAAERLAKGDKRTLPMQYLTAYYNTVNDYWKPALDDAATVSLANVPTLAGRTLVLVDTSGSMNAPFTSRGRARTDPGVTPVMRWDAAALFGIALGRACAHADVVSFSAAGYNTWPWQTQSRNNAASIPFPLKPGENLLSAVARFRKDAFIGGGTDTGGAVTRHFAGHDRIVVLTDEEVGDFGRGGVFSAVPATTPTYTFNLAGYGHAHAPTTRYRHIVAGLTDSAFAMIAALETRRAGRWPWQD